MEQQQEGEMMTTTTTLTMTTTTMMMVKMMMMVWREGGSWHACMCVCAPAVVAPQSPAPPGPSGLSPRSHAARRRRYRCPCRADVSGCRGLARDATFPATSQTPPQQRSIQHSQSVSTRPNRAVLCTRSVTLVIAGCFVGGSLVYALRRRQVPCTQRSRGGDDDGGTAVAVVVAVAVAVVAVVVAVVAVKAVKAVVAVHAVAAVAVVADSAAVTAVSLPTCSSLNSTVSVGSSSYPPEGNRCDDILALRYLARHPVISTPPPHNQSDSHA
eukprot:COSAG05_NODE_1687_length_4280_cov_15.580244_7_plen_270_part_00